MSIEIVCEKIITDAFSITSAKTAIHKKAKAYKIKSLKALSHDKLPREYNNRFPKVDMSNGERVRMDIIPDVNHYYSLSIGDVLLAEDFEVISKIISQARDQLDAIKKELKKEAEHWTGITTFDFSFSKDEKSFMIECDKILINDERAFQIIDLDGPKYEDLPQEYQDGDHKEVAFIKPNRIVIGDSHGKRSDLTKENKYYIDEFDRYVGIITRVCKKLEEARKKSEWSGEVTFKF